MNERQKQPDPMLTEPVLPLILRFALPNMLGMLAMAAVAIAETSYVGLLGTASLAGLALVFPMIMLQGMLSAGAMGGGVSSAIARAIGGGDVRRAQTLAFHATMIGTLGGLFFMVLFLGFGRPIFTLLGGKGEALEQALLMSGIVFLGAVPIWLTNTFASILRGMGNMRVPSQSLLGIAVLHVSLGGGLGLGLGPFPRFGIAGVAAGQLIAYTLGAAFLLWYLGSGRARFRLEFKDIPFQKTLFADILRVGAVACFSPLQSVMTVLILTSLVASVSTEALAGYGIGSRLEFLLIPIAFAFGVACVPLVGMAIGAGDVARARRVAWVGSGLAAALLGVVGFVVAIFPDLWARLFTSDPAVLASARSYLQWSGPSYWLFGLGLCLYFASQGAGKVLGPVLGGTVRLAVVMIGGIWVVQTGAPPWAMFALVGLSMTAYGLATALAVYIVPWGPVRQQA